MPRFFHPLILMLASLTRHELVRQIQYLKAENEILRAKLPRRVAIAPDEQRRLIRLGRAVGPNLKHLMTIVSYRTFRRWLGDEKSGRPSRQRGRPRTPEEIRDLILRLAEENGWGYTRIVGELRKLGIRGIARSTVGNILKANGLDPGPQRGEGSWDEFIRMHAQTLWACDFITKKVWTKFGVREFFVLFFIHVGSRRVYVPAVTAHPDAAWVAQQARNFTIHMAEQGQTASILIRDGDKKFTAQFNAILEADDIAIKKLTPNSPNLNAFAERWVRSLRKECLDHFVIIGEGHLRYLVAEYVEFYNHHRPHQGLGNRLLTPPDEKAAHEAGPVVCEERLGGLLRHYYRKVA